LPDCKRSAFRKIVAGSSELLGDLTMDGILGPMGVAKRPVRLRVDAVLVRIALSGETRKARSQRLQQAYANHAPRLIRRMHALVGLAEGKAVGEMAQLGGGGDQTVREWLPAVVVNGVARLS
jgi:hypothetical protein